MVKVALLVRLDAKPGKEAAVAKFLEGAFRSRIRKAPRPSGSHCALVHPRLGFSMRSPMKRAGMPILQVRSQPH